MHSLLAHPLAPMQQMPDNRGMSDLKTWILAVTALACVALYALLGLSESRWGLCWVDHDCAPSGVCVRMDPLAGQCELTIPTPAD